MTFWRGMRFCFWVRKIANNRIFKSLQQGAAGKCDFCHFFGAPTSKNNEKSISRIIDFCLSITFLRDFYRVRKIDRTFDLSSKHRFGFYGIRGNMYA
jgi:hypothetical protein